MKGPLSSFPNKSPPKRSARIRKSERKKVLEQDPVAVDEKTLQQWRQIQEDKLVNWLDREFSIPQPEHESFAAYYDQYATNNKSVERRCFQCKEIVDLKNAFFCSSSKCTKVYHKSCLEGHHSNLCPLHFCFSCKSRAKEGVFCHMCPTTYCTTCDVAKHNEKKHMTLCAFCAAVCSSGNLYNVLDDLLV